MGTHLDGLDLQFQSGILVHHDHGVRVKLERGQSPHVVHAALDTFLQGEGLVGTGDDDNDLAGLEHGLHTDGQGHLGHLLEVVVEESTVGEDGVVGQGLDTGARRQRGAGLIEGDMSIGANAAQEEVNATVGLDGGFVGYTLGLEIWRIAIEDVDVARVDIDVREEVLVHERVVGFWVLAGDPDVLILWSGLLDTSCTNDIIYARYGAGQVVWLRLREADINLGAGVVGYLSRRTILNVTTFSKEISPALYFSTRIL